MEHIPKKLPIFAEMLTAIGMEFGLHYVQKAAQWRHKNKKPKNGKTRKQNVSHW